ncbi:hypothetical protein CEXT_281551 [Caerostris extrusa]|uniref:Uncharacterized protein n=1 Tax=Caerostris extrusa TaxID=172846 RepID=A0AAV4YF68_CAEEX|nr:hypothetical protein CEXT_281551 [Caerostris extrusa]
MISFDLITAKTSRKASVIVSSYRSSTKAIPIRAFIRKRPDQVNMQSVPFLRLGWYVLLQTLFVWFARIIHHRRNGCIREDMALHFRSFAQNVG